MLKAFKSNDDNDDNDDGVFTLFQNSSLWFHVVYFVKFWWFFSGVEL